MFMEYNVLVVWKIQSKVNNIYSEQFWYSENYIVHVRVFIVYLNIE